MYGAHGIVADKDKKRTVRTGKEDFDILIADRNPHIREFLARELGREGYRVTRTGDGRDVLSLVSGPDCPDLIVLDLDLPFVDGLVIMDFIRKRNLNIQIIVHTCLVQQLAHPAIENAAGIIEKTGDNLDRLKGMVDEFARRRREGVPEAAE